MRKYLSLFLLTTLVGFSLSRAATVISTNPLPNPKITPGAIDPTVTQANIHQTICVPGYSKAHRPPNGPAWHRRMIAIAHKYMWDSRPGLEEYDHVVAIEDGGAADDDRNLWPEPTHVNANGYDEGFHEKDRVEDAVHRGICNDTISLNEARTQMAKDWTVLYKKYVSPTFQKFVISN